MRFFSTPESSNNLEFTWLSLIESFFACSVSIYVAFNIHTYTHIVIAICLTPALLLRTEKSTQNGLKLLDKYHNRLSMVINPINESHNKIGIALVKFSQFLQDKCKKNMDLGITRNQKIFVIIGILFSLLMMMTNIFLLLVTNFFLIFTYLCIVIFVLVGATLVKIYSTTVNILAHPIESVSSIPINWYRIIFATDSCHPPEIIPGIEVNYKYSGLSEFKFSNMRGYYDQARVKNKIDSYLLPVVALVFILPALLYRWALKASLIFYFPLLLIIHRAKRVDASKTQVPNTLLTNGSLEIETTGVASKVKLFYAVLVIIISIASFSLSTYINQWISHLKELSEFLRTWVDYWFFTPNSTFKVAQITDGVIVNSWHLSRLFAAIVTIILFVYAEKVLIIRRNILAHHEVSAPIILFWLRLIQAIFSLFTLTCGFYLIILPVLIEIKWSEIEIDWVPWA